MRQRQVFEPRVSITRVQPTQQGVDVELQLSPGEGPLGTVTDIPTSVEVVVGDAESNTRLGVASDTVSAQTGQTSFTTLSVSTGGRLPSQLVVEATVRNPVSDVEAQARKEFETGSNQPTSGQLSQLQRAGLVLGAGVALSVALRELTG